MARTKKEKAPIGTFRKAKKVAQVKTEQTRSQKKKRSYALVPKVLSHAIERMELAVAEGEEQMKDVRLERIYVNILKEREKEIKERGSKNAGRYPFNASSYEREWAILNKLVSAWRIGASDVEASNFAGVSLNSLRTYLKKYPELAEYRKELKSNPVFIARNTVVKNLPDNPGLAFRFLQSKLPQEFALGRFAGETEKDTPKDIPEQAKQAWELIKKSV